MKNLVLSSFMALALVAFAATGCTASETASAGVEKSTKSAKCGTGKCGDGKAETKKAGDSKCGEGKATTKKCGDGKDKAEASKCGAGKCGGGK